MNLKRGDFLKGLLLASGGFGLGGCSTMMSCCTTGRIAVQLYSIRSYICGDKNFKGVGLATALEDLATIGYKGVEFAGYYGLKASQIRHLLDANGIKACGTHVHRDDFSPAKIKQTCEFNLAYGNNLIICPGGGNFPPGCSWGKVEYNDKVDGFAKMLTEYYATAAETAAQYGCKIGFHNHAWEFQLKLANGQTFWDYFFSNTPANVVMEQDVGWTANAGYDPAKEFAKYPGRSITLHAKENGFGAKDFEGILGQPGTGAKGVDWQKVRSAAEADGVQWWVVECERNCNSLKAVAPSYVFLKQLGLN